MYTYCVKVQNVLEKQKCQKTARRQEIILEFCNKCLLHAKYGLECVLAQDYIRTCAKLTSYTVHHSCNTLNSQQQRTWSMYFTLLL